MFEKSKRTIAWQQRELRERIDAIHDTVQASEETCCQQRISLRSAAPARFFRRGLVRYAVTLLVRIM